MKTFKMYNEDEVRQEWEREEKTFKRIEAEHPSIEEDEIYEDEIYEDEDKEQLLADITMFILTIMILYTMFSNGGI